jgi:hypothetical protein
LQLKLYAQAVRAERSSLHTALLDIPEVFLAPEELEKLYPPLVARDCKISYVYVAQKALASRIALTRTWEWELQDASWALLQQHFPFLCETVPLKADSVERRSQILEQLSPQQRFEVDEWSRMCIVESSPEEIRSALDELPMEEAVVYLRKEGTRFPFSRTDICGSDGAALQDLLELAVCRGREPSSPQETAASERLAFLRTEGGVYYRIQVLERSHEKRIMTFAEVFSDGTLQRLLDRRLQDSYAEVRKKNPAWFRGPHGDWKPWEEVRELIGASLYFDLLKSAKNGDKQPDLDQWTRKSLLQYVSQIREQMVHGTFCSPKDPMAAQWCLIREDVAVQRGKKDEGVLPKEQVFNMREGEWSPVMTFSPEGFSGHGSGDWGFFRQERIEKVHPHVRSLVDEGSHLLHNEAKCVFLQDMYARIEASHSSK